MPELLYLTDSFYLSLVQSHFVMRATVSLNFKHQENILPDV